MEREGSSRAEAARLNGSRSTEDLPVRDPAGALQVAELVVGVAQRLFARRPGPREHHRAVVKELDLDLRRLRPVAQVRVYPRVLLAYAPDADVRRHCRPK